MYDTSFMQQISRLENGFLYKKKKKLVHIVMYCSWCWWLVVSAKQYFMEMEILFFFLCQTVPTPPPPPNIYIIANVRVFSNILECCGLKLKSILECQLCTCLSIIRQMKCEAQIQPSRNWVTSGTKSVVISVDNQLVHICKSGAVFVRFIQMRL